MRIVTLAARPGWHTDELERAARERGHEHHLCRYEDLVAFLGARSGLQSGATPLDDADAVLARIIPNGTLEQIIFRMDALHRLSERGVRVVNTARAIERSVDKFWTSALLEQAGLPTPDTVVTESVADPSAVVGTINIYQVGEWAVAHVWRHDAQAERALAHAGGKGAS